MILRGRGISKGTGRGSVLVSESPISFLGGLNSATGVLTEPCFNGESVKDRVFAFPRGKGSTVGSYVMLEMRRQGTLPAAILNSSTEPIVATGAVMSGVPLVDRIDLSLLKNGDECMVNGDDGTVELPRVNEKHVVSCVLREGNDILLLKRSYQVSSFQGYWAAISGFVENDELPLETARREIREEAEIQDVELITSAEPLWVRSASTVWVIHPFLFRSPHRQIKTDWEHTEYRWLLPSDVQGFQTVPGFDRVLHNLNLLA